MKHLRIIVTGVSLCIAVVAFTRAPHVDLIVDRVSLLFLGLVGVAGSILGLVHQSDSGKVIRQLAAAYALLAVFFVIATGMMRGMSGAINPQLSLSDELTIQANEALGRGDYEIAADLYRQVIAMDSTRADSYAGLAYALLLDKQFEQAEPVARKAISLSNSARDWYFLGRAYDGLGRYEEAIDAMQHSIDAEGPDDAAYHLALGEIFYDQSKFAEAHHQFGLAKQLEGHRSDELGTGPWPFFLVVYAAKLVLEPLLILTLWGGIFCLGGAYATSIRDQFRRPAGIPVPVRSRGLGLALRIIGALMIVGGLVLLDFAFPTVSSFSRFIGVGFFLPGMLVVYAGYRVGIPRGDQVLSNDKRAPVLFLRSFQDDSFYDLNSHHWFGYLIGLRVAGLPRPLSLLANIYPLRILRLVLGKASDTMEEQLAHYYRGVGPFVAIGRPGDRMVPGGAARLYLNDDQWRETVSQLMESAQLVIIQVGTTVGIRWEIASAVERLSPDRILLSLAPLKLNRWKEPSLTPKQRLFSRLPAISPSGYQAFRASMGGIFPAGLPHNVADAQFIRFMSDWEPQLIRVHERSPMVFPFVSVTADLRESFRAPLDESSKAELPHAPRGHRGHGLLALITYVVLPLAVSMQLAGLIGETPAPPSSNDRTIQDGAISRAIRIQPTDLSFSILGREGFRRESIASSVTFYSGDGTTEAASFGVARLDGVAQEDSLASAFTESIEIEGFSPSMITKFTVSIDGRDWTSLEATSHDTRGTRTASLRCHSGDLGTFVMVSAARAQTESTVATWRTISGRMFESFKFQTIPDSAYVGSLKQHR